jgi:Ferritin-like
LTAIGGVPSVAHASFLPKYPLKTLPGGISQKMAIDLTPLTHKQIAVFMQIEYPKFPPIDATLAKRPATIGAFYSTIAAAFNKLQPNIDANALWVEVPFAKKIQSITDAIATIERIKSEGEGLEGSPEEPLADHSFAHYYLFKEIYVGRRLIKVGGKRKFDGESVSLPKVFDFKHCWLQRKRSVPFREELSQLLLDLQACWSLDQAPNVPGMFQLQIQGRELIERGICPVFEWISPRDSG